MDVSGNTDFGILYIDQLANDTPPPPPILTLDDLLSSAELITQKEAEDKATLEAIGKIPIDTLKPKLVEWAIAKFPNNFEVYRLAITPPDKCSDGVTRNLPDYIEFCSGKTFEEHMAPLRQKVSGMTFSFANMGSHIAVFASTV